VSGSGGCNRFTGSYELNGERLTFGETAGTMMACIEGMETEKEFFAALKQVRRARSRASSCSCSTPKTSRSRASRRST
jgi:copper homeostasis protein (lipoprotein)